MLTVQIPVPILIQSQRVLELVMSSKLACKIIEARTKITVKEIYDFIQYQLDNMEEE